jgi:glycerate kinase
LRILLAPDKFKGTFTAAEVCAHLRAGILESAPGAEVVDHPLADGGDGTLAVLIQHLGGDLLSVAASGPRGEPLLGEAGRLHDGALVLESALFCGLSLVPVDQRNPMRTTTYGMGVALRHLLSPAPRRVLVGLGGSATVDGGIGLARAFGFRFLGRDGRDLQGVGADLEALETIVAPDGWVPPARGAIRALCDVANPLTGPTGAAASFARQKGASLDETRRLEAGLSRLGSMVRRDLGIEVTGIAGGGAAGGLGTALHAFLSAELVPGAAEIMSMTGLERRLEGVDLAVTGEGAIDPGSSGGKIVGAVVQACRAKGIPVVVVCGRDDGSLFPDDVEVLKGAGVTEARDLLDTGKSLGRR